jgi:anti-anti-sigma regulatory factor/CRP-like cAMP-binding protein
VPDLLHLTSQHCLGLIGVVKYVANGTVIHSTIERPFRKCDWLIDNGDFIQILVLQNYLFFGNASAVYGYIDSMFQRNEEDGATDQLETRRPKFLILDLTLVTGMDTSTVDIFNEIRNLCTSNHCKLFVTGLTPDLRGVLNLGGFKPETTVRSKRKLRFFASLDAALGKAEDLLLDADGHDKEASSTDNRARLLSEGDFGFRTALRHIDEEHGDNFSLELLGWQNHTQLVEMNPGDRLYEDKASEDLERGLFFIEVGVMVSISSNRFEPGVLNDLVCTNFASMAQLNPLQKIEHETSATLTRGGTFRSSSIRDPQANVSRTDSLTRIQAMEYSNILEASRSEESRTFRLARIGPGWIAGTLEAVSGRQRPGKHVAVTHCRLHHLSFTKIAEVEKTNPALVLHLYKLLAYMMARRQEATIGQLATLHSIMTSPANSKVLHTNI